MTHGEKSIVEAIKVLKLAIVAGDLAEEAFVFAETKKHRCNWRKTATEIGRCIEVLSSIPSHKLADVTWGQ